MNELPQIMNTVASYHTSDQTSGGWISHRPHHAYPQTWPPESFAAAHTILSPTISRQPEITNVSQPKARVVRVYVVDPDENVAVERRMLYQGGEQFTDLTDQELFFEIDLKETLARHNEYRKTLKEKTTADREPQTLEPIRIRDLKMVVMTMAEF